MADLDAEWARVWGWRPRRQPTVYLYFDGYRMADGLVTLSGQPLTAKEKSDIARTVYGRYFSGFTRAPFLNTSK